MSDSDLLDDFEEHIPSTKDERTLAMLSHLSTFAGYVIPFGNIIAPLVIWQVKKDESSYVAEHAKEALNFQITIMLAFIVSAILVLVLVGVVLLVVVAIAQVAFSIIAAIKANDGEPYKYPFTLRLVS